MNVEHSNGDLFVPDYGRYQESWMSEGICPIRRIFVAGKLMADKQCLNIPDGCVVDVNPEDADNG